MLKKYYLPKVNRNEKIYNNSYIVLAFLIKFHVVKKFPHLKIKWGGDWKGKYFDPYHWQMTLK